MTTLDTLRKSAKRWLKALRDGDPAARARLARAWPEAPERPTLRDVQHALARERGHQSWIALTRASEATPADAGHPTCRKYNDEYTQAQSVDEGRVRMKPVNTGSPVASV